MITFVSLTTNNILKTKNFLSFALCSLFFSVCTFLQTPTATFAQSSYCYNWNELNGQAFGGIMSDNNGTLYTAGLKTQPNYPTIFLTKSNAAGIFEQGVSVHYPQCWPSYPSIGHFNDNTTCLILPIDTMASEWRITIHHFDENLQLDWAKATVLNPYYLLSPQTNFTLNNEIWFTTINYETGTESIILFAINEQGNLTQQHQYQLPIFNQDGFSIDNVSDIKTTLDGNFIVLAQGQNGFSSDFDGISILLKITPQGEILWSKTLNNTTPINSFWLNHIVCNPDSSYLLTGGYGIGTTSDFLLIKIDNQGDVLWTKTYDWGDNDAIWWQLERSAANDGYIGLFSDYTYQNNGWQIACFDEEGNMCWRKNYANSLWLRNFVAQADGYVFPTSNIEYTENDTAILSTEKMGIAKADLNGNIAVDCWTTDTSTFLPSSSPNITSANLEVIHSITNFALVDVIDRVVVNELNTTSQPYECPPPIALFQLSDTLLCPNTCIIATDSSLNNPSEWLWLMPGALPDTYSGIDPPPFCYNQAGSYTVSLIVSNNYGSDTASINIVVDAAGCIAPTASFLLNETQICPNDCVIATNLLPDNELSYVWHANGASPNTYLGIDPPPFCYNQAGSYSIQLMASNALDTVIVEKNLIVNNLSTAETTIEYCIGNTYTWNGLVLTQNGDYTDTLINTLGCDSISVLHLKFAECEQMHVLFPNAFSPNSDGTNDVWRPYIAHTLNNYSLQIYNRWGQLLFDTQDANQTWDGNYQGTPCSMGVYVWQVQYQVTENGIIQTLNNKGNVTLIR